MKRSVLVIFALVGILLVWVAPRWSPPVFGQAAAAQAPHIGEGGLRQCGCGGRRAPPRVFR